MCDWLEITISLSDLPGLHLKGHFIKQHKLNICLCSVTFFFTHPSLYLFQNGLPNTGLSFSFCRKHWCVQISQSLSSASVCIETCLWSTTHVEKPLWLRFPLGYFAFIASLKTPGSNRYDSKLSLNLLDRLYKPSVSDVSNLFHVLALFILFKWCSMTCIWCCVDARSTRLSHF